MVLESLVLLLPTYLTHFSFLYLIIVYCNFATIIYLFLIPIELFVSVLQLYQETFKYDLTRTNDADKGFKRF